MRKILLGKTGIEATCQAFGALPIQRTEEAEAIRILQRAYDGGINFFDTARAYSNSEEKLGKAFSPSMRANIHIATKSMGRTKDALLEDIQTSLKLLNTDYVDILQTHNIKENPNPEEENGVYEGLIEAQKRGYCKFIGITSHRLDIAKEAVATGLYDTVQFPISYLSSQEDLDLIALAKEQNMGILAMKALAGGLIASAKGAAAFMNENPTLLPLWGIQHMTELEEFLSYGENPPTMTGDVAEIVAKDKEELSGNFCRACGYCMPCTVAPELQMNMAVRMYYNLRRMPVQASLTPHWQQQMLLIEKCVDCGACKSRCPYGLDCPTIMRANLADYREVAKKHGIII